MNIRGVDPNHYSRQGLKFHPIKFAGYCWCAKCKSLVKIVETDHPNGLDRGPWTVKVFCHGSMYSMRLSEEAVTDFVEGRVVPMPTMFFETDGEPRPLSVSEVCEIEVKAKGPIFGLHSDLRVKLNAALFEKNQPLYLETLTEKETR